MIQKLRRSIPSVYISEMFDSIQGEGGLAGYRTLFIRTQGCHVGCKWCDTKYSWKIKDDKKLKVTDLVSEIKKRVDVNSWLCFTGGEPLEQLKSLMWVIEKLNQFGYTKISLETAGIDKYEN